MIDSEDIALWIKKAEEDLAVVNKLFDEHDNFFGGSIGFHCQQSIEKFLKVYLATFDQEIPKTHSL
jgi:HEPN domain-containing protein